MSVMDIGPVARSGEWCDICRKYVYLNVWGHIAMHKRELQRREDGRAMRENGERFMERLREACKAR